MPLPRPSILIVDPDLIILDRTVGTSWRADQDVIGQSLIAATAAEARQETSSSIRRAYSEPHAWTSRDIHGWTWLVHATRDGRRDRIRLDATPIDTPPIWRVVVHSAHGASLPLLTTPHRHRATQVAHRVNTGRLVESGLSAEVIRLF